MRKKSKPSYAKHRMVLKMPKIPTKMRRYRARYANAIYKPWNCHAINAKPICQCALPRYAIRPNFFPSDFDFCRTKMVIILTFSQGQHIAQEDVAACPSCDFLCFKPQMTKYVPTLIENKHIHFYLKLLISFLFEQFFNNFYEIIILFIFN